MVKIYLIVLIMLFCSCNSRQKQEKDANKRLKHIEQLIAENAFNAAKIEIDSLHSLFPRLINKRKIAAAFADTILRRESARTLRYCESILPQKQHELDSILMYFRFEKNTNYQQYGNYIYKSQITENNSTRNYLKAYVDENADLYLISNYCGSKIEHMAIEVATADLYAHTDTLDTSNPAYHSFNDGGSHWENLTFKNEADKGVTTFIAQNSTSRLKVSLSGKKKYVYYLADADKKAIAETYRLWIIKKDVAQLQKEIKKASNKIATINNRK